MKNENCKIKIVFMGSPEIGAIILSNLIKAGIKINSVITRPDRPKGRSGKPEKTPVKILSEQNNISIYQPYSKNELTEIIKDICPDICIVAAYGMIIPTKALEIPKYGMINFHPSLLPKYRGPSPITEPILNGDKKTGVSIIQVSERMDAGDILAQEKIKLDGTETTPTLSEKLASLGTKMIINLLSNNKIFNISHVRQDDNKASYTKIITKNDGKLFFKNMTATQIERMSRAYTPWPGIYCYWNEKKIDFFDIKVDKNNIKPGLITKRDNRIIIGCKKGSISVGTLKIESKNKVTAEEFLRGYPNFSKPNFD